MERLIEQPVGEGDVFDGANHLGRVHYHLSVYRHFSDVESEPVPAHLEVEGRIMPIEGVDVPRLHHERSELTLHLADGRLLECWVADEAGSIRSTARGLRAPGPV